VLLLLRVCVWLVLLRLDWYESPSLPTIQALLLCLVPLLTTLELDCIKSDAGVAEVILDPVFQIGVLVLLVEVYMLAVKAQTWALTSVESSWSRLTAVLVPARQYGEMVARLLSPLLNHCHKRRRL